MNDPFLIRAEELSVSYDGKEVLNCPELIVQPNDFIGVIGPNGGGKTTLIKALLHNVPYKGAVQYGEAVFAGGVRRIGYLPQVHDVDKSFPIPVKEVVLSGLQAEKKMMARYTKSDRDKAKELLEMTGIGGLKNRPIGELSGGEFQRMVLCRALISNPVLLILDEPNNFVDNAFENELYRLLSELNERMAVVMVSHDLGTITQYVKSIVCVNHHAHYHPSNEITPEQLENYHCPIQLVYHGDVPHTVLNHH